MKKLRVYVDMDGVLCNYAKRYLETISEKNTVPQSQYGFFTSLEEIPGAVEAINLIAEEYDTWILTRPSTKNPLCYTEKRVWVEQHLGMKWVERLIICPEKSLLNGDILIDDFSWSKFDGIQYLFGSKSYPDWDSILQVLKIKKTEI